MSIKKKRLLREKSKLKKPLAPKPIEVRTLFNNLKSEIKDYDICIVITTYDRSEMLEDLIKDIIRDKDGFNILVSIFDDASSKSLDVSKFGDELDIIYFKYKQNHGKRRFWELITNTMEFCKNINSKYFIYLQDDNRLINDFFNRAIKIFESIEDETKIALNLLKINNLKEGSYSSWSNYRAIKPSENLFKSQVLEPMFISTKKLLEELDYNIQPQTPNPKKSSGVGRNMSYRLHKKGLSMFHPKKTLVNHGNHPSKMNPSPQTIIVNF